MPHICIAKSTRCLSEAELAPYEESREVSNLTNELKLVAMKKPALSKNYLGSKTLLVNHPTRGKFKDYRI